MTRSFIVLIFITTALSVPAAAETVRCLRGFPSASGGSARYRVAGNWVEVIATYEPSGKAVVSELKWSGSLLESRALIPAEVRYLPDGSTAFLSEVGSEPLLVVKNESSSGIWRSRMELGCSTK